MGDVETIIPGEARLARTLASPKSANKNRKTCFLQSNIKNRSHESHDTGKITSGSEKLIRPPGIATLQANLPGHKTFGMTAQIFFEPGGLTVFIPDFEASRADNQITGNHRI